MFHYTHYTPLKGGKGFHVYNLDKCEQCDTEVEAPNSVNFIEPESKLKMLGMERREEEPLSEIWWSEELGKAVCMDCWETAKQKAELEEDRNETPKLKGMTMSVYRDANGKDFTNSGISSKVQDITVIGNWDDGSPIPEIFEPTEDRPAMILRTDKMYLDGYIYLEPAHGADPSQTPYMFGGNFAYSSDSRCPKFPIPIHDRQDTWEDYDILSR